MDYEYNKPFNGLAFNMFLKSNLKDAIHFAIACNDNWVLSLAKRGYLIRCGLRKEYRAIKIIISHMSNRSVILKPLFNRKAEVDQYLGFRLYPYIDNISQDWIGPLYIKSSNYGCDDALYRLKYVCELIDQPNPLKELSIASEQTIETSTIGGPHLYHTLNVDDAVWDIKFRLLEGNLSYGFIGSRGISGKVAIAEKIQNSDWWHFPCFSRENPALSLCLAYHPATLSLQLDRPFCRIQISYKTCAYDNDYRTCLARSNSNTQPSNIPILNNQSTIRYLAGMWGLYNDVYNISSLPSIQPHTQIPNSNLYNTTNFTNLIQGSNPI